MSKRMKLLAAGLALTLLAVVAVSQTVKRVHMHGHGSFSEHMLEHMTRDLDLSDAQQAQAKEIIAKEKPGMQALFQQMHQGHQAMMQLVTSGNFDENKARDIASQQSQAMIQMEVQKAKTEAELFQLLTPDQKTKAVQLMNEHMQRMQRHVQEQAPPAQ
jgi:protein CpxP